MIATSYETPVGAWEHDAAPEIAAAGFLAHTRARLIRPDVYGLNVFMTEHFNY